MDKIKRYLNKYKFVIVAVVLLFIMVFAGVKVVEYFMPDSKEANYGDRLDTKPDTTALITTLTNKLKEIPFVQELKVWNQGNIIKITTNVKDDVNMIDAKALGNVILANVTETEKAYFDFQLYVTKSDKSKTDFPIIGQKHPQKDAFSWTKDRVDN